MCVKSHKTTTHTHIQVCDLSRERPEGSIFNSYYTEVYGRELLFSVDCYTYPSSVPYNANTHQVPFFESLV